jgi:hypothetical protein
VRPRLTLLAALVAGVLPVAGCGDSSLPVPTNSTAPSRELRALEFPRAGLKVSLPRNMQVGRLPRLPAVFRATLAQPFVSGYAYRRAEQLPRNERELQAARRRLVRTAQGRDRGYRLVRSRATKVAGARAVELLGEQTLGRTRLRIRSLHVYRGNAEYVIEVGAPRRQFARFDRVVTPGIEGSLSVTGRVARRN